MGRAATGGLGARARRGFGAVFFALRWLVGALVCAVLSLTLVVWLTAGTLRDVLDSRQVWVGLMSELHLAEGVRGAVRSQAAHLALSAAVSPEAEQTLREALERDFDERLGSNLDAVVGYLSARDATLRLDWGVEPVLAAAAGQAAAKACAQADVAAVGAGCEAGARLATKASSWLVQREWVDGLNAAVFEAVSGVHHLRAAALVGRLAIKLAGLLNLALALLAALVVWRLRSVCTLLAMTCAAVSALLTPLVLGFEATVGHLVGPATVSAVVSAAGTRPLGVRVQLLVALVAVAAVAARVTLPRWRAAFWARHQAHPHPEVRARAAKCLGRPADVREPYFMLRALGR